MMKKTSGLVALLAAAVLTLSGCSGSDTGSDGASGSDGHNQQDVTFAAEMIPHHEQAVQMAQMAEGHGGSEEFEELTSNIEAAQAPEIETMTGWLESWGEEVPSSSMDGMDHGSMADMAGMMSEDDLAELDDADGGAFEQMWLRGMIAHHEGAVEMSDTQIEKGESADAIELARTIKSAQTEEIATMEQMLES